MPHRDFSRTDRVGAEIQRELAFLLQREVKDPRLPITTVSTVRVSKDLQNANVYVTFLNCDEQEQRSIAVNALNHMAGYLRTMLSGRVRMRAMPRLMFHFDEVMQRGQRMNTLITSAIASDEARRGEQPRDDSEE